MKLVTDSVVDFILTLIIEFSIKSYVYPEIFSSAQKISLKRFFDSCAQWGEGAQNFRKSDHVVYGWPQRTPQLPPLGMHGFSKFLVWSSSLMRQMG